MDHPSHVVHMSGAKVNIKYFRPDPIDIIMEQEEGRKVEYSLELLVEKMRKKGAVDEQIAVELVEESCTSYVVRHFQKDDGTIFIPPFVDVHKKYLRRDYWNEKFTKAEYSKDFWLQKYYNKDLSRAIPEDRIDRMVLYFLQDYLKVMFSEYILDKDICESERLAVLKKQLENFSFYSRRKPFGGIWKVSSEPNKLLREALRSREDSDSGSSENDDPEKAVSAQEESNSDKFVDSGVHCLDGSRVFVAADKSLPGDAGDGAKLDSADKDIFNGVQQYAKTRLKPDAVHKSWTMVRCGFHVPSKNTDFRCYAFSGHAQSGKELHQTPGEWWGQCEDKPENTEIVNVDASQFGHNMVLALFTALKPTIKEDLSKLVSHTVFEEYEDLHHLILTTRQDIAVLDYGVFLDNVISLCKNFDEKIITSINTSISRLNVPSGKKLTDMSNEIWKCVSVGSCNKQFGPNKERLDELLSEKFEPELTKQITNIMVSISQNILSKFETKIKELPEVYLGTLLKELQKSRCAEDNAIGSVLRRLLLLNNTDAFLNTSVTFVAMDANNQDGKPFCSVCAHKVRFYSALPMLLRAIGSTGKDFDELAPLFAKLR